MRLGILADIHEEVEYLDQAVQLLQQVGVDQFVILGDIFDMGKRLLDTVAILTSINSVGVWGNHDYGLCCQVTDHVKEHYPAEVLRYFATLQPWLEIEGSRFQHIEPFLDSTSLEDLWAFGNDGVLDPARGFAACPHQRIFIGHMHRWELLTETGIVPWTGQQPIRLEPEQRYLAVIHAVQQGWCAWYDTTEEVLIPLSVRS